MRKKPGRPKGIIAGKKQTHGEIVRTQSFIQDAKDLWAKLFAKNKWQAPTTVMVGPIKMKRMPTRKKRP